MRNKKKVGKITTFSAEVAKRSFHKKLSLNNNSYLTNKSGAGYSSRRRCDGSPQGPSDCINI